MKADHGNNMEKVGHVDSFYLSLISRIRFKNHQKLMIRGDYGGLETQTDAVDEDEHEWATPGLVKLWVRPNPCGPDSGSHFMYVLV